MNVARTGTTFWVMKSPTFFHSIPLPPSAPPRVFNASCTPGKIVFQPFSSAGHRLPVIHPPKRSTAGRPVVVNQLANLSRTGSSFVPTSSLKFPHATRILSPAVALAAAVPPTCDSTSRMMIFCALRVSPDSTRALICFFWPSVKVTPARPRAVMPFSGSLRALPSIFAALFASPNPAAAMSCAAAVARLKMSLPLPASLRTCLKVSNKLALDWIASSSTPVLRLIASARSPTCFAVILDAPPVALTIWFVIAETFCASRASSTAPVMKVPIASPTLAAAPIAMSGANTFDAMPLTPPSIEPCIPSAIPAPDRLPVSRACRSMPRKCLSTSLGI